MKAIWRRCFAREHELAASESSHSAILGRTPKRGEADWFNGFKWLHPRIHQKHWTDPGDGGSVSRTFDSPGTDLNFKRFETYVKAKDLDLWHIILNGDFPPVARNKETQVLEMVPFEQQDDDLKKKLAKNNEAKMVLYNALPKKEYERIFMCKTAKDIWQSLLITHQGNSQVKDNKIDLLVQQYEQFTILEEESIDSGFARFNTIITSLKALDEGFSSKNYVRKFLRALHPKWRAKVTAIEESKDLSSLALDELIGNLKVHEVVMEKDSKIYRGKKERVKSIALKAKKESSDDETLTSRSDDEEYAMAVRNFKKFFRRKGKFVRQPREEKKSFRQRDEKKGKSDRKCFRCGDPNHLIGDFPKPSRNKDQKAFIGGSWSDSENDAEDKTNDETCLMAQSLNEVTLNSSHYSDDASSLDNDSLGFDSDKASKSGTKTMSFVGSSAEKGTDGSTIKVHESTLPGSVCLRTCLEPDGWIKDSGCSKHMTGNKSLFSTYKAYDGGTKWVFRNKLDENGIVSRNKARLVAQGYNQQECIDYDETYALVARLESIRILLAIAFANDFKLYQMDVKSAFLNGFINEEVYVAQPSGFIDFQKPNYVYKLKKALYGLKQAPKAWYDRLKAFLIKHEYSMGMVDNTLFTKKSKSHLIIVQIYVDDIIFGSTSQNLCDDFAKVMHDEFKMSMMGKLNFFVGLQIKQMEDGIFFNQSKYIKEMLKKFGSEDSKPTKTAISMEIKLTKDDEADSVDSSKYQGTKIETVVYADSDHAGDYVDRKSTSGICTFMRCYLTSWFAKKQKAIAISTTEAEYISAGKACQQALWMKQALIDYGIRLDNVPIMCDNKGAIDLSKNPVQHSRTKHIEIRHHFLRDNVRKGNISIKKVASEDNIADIFTKPLKREVFNYLRLGLGMMELIMDSDSPLS
ncbi:retrovirus-related pol polyprotein from transposon TNT 1-94 [Tanacetum coccineum]|uniref:Retrovirus-related pol polyprotein from transposon TNT 1-94 n=1 Tax=Tanacetum coccineum TaxID=301880 RepID=A0ABQ4ZL05_9ASTR